MKDSCSNVFGDLYKQPFTLSEAAEYLCISEEALYRMAKEGQIRLTYKQSTPVFTLEDLNAIKPRFQAV